MTERIWLTWERQRRNQTLSKALDATLYEIVEPLPRMRRWVKAIGSTWLILQRERPQVVFAQNPSLIMALLTVWYGRLTGQVTLIDSHNAGIYPFFGRMQWRSRLARPLMQKLVHHVMRLADLTIVSNAPLAEYVDSVGGHGFVLPDPLPEFKPQGEPACMEDGVSVLFICTWAADEPYAEVIKAASVLGAGTRVYITGNSKGREADTGLPLPPNVILTGFVPEDDFVQLLHAADVVMDLTTLENCLVCGAYESVAAGTPLILSDTEALRGYFRKGVVFTANDADSIATALRQAIADRQRLRGEIKELRQELIESWRLCRDELNVWLSERLLRGSSTQKSGKL
jgi:glycosyltransferase involved in cell wall biosynthesis